MASYITYANQGAVRNQPLSEGLTSALSYLEDMGLTAEVFSGGQPQGGLDNIGSHRHDGGDSADMFLRKGGERLDWNNPEHLPYFMEFVERGRGQAGLTGFGAGEGYMQPGSVHAGFGDPAVWGADGKGENAASWLRDAYYGVGPTQARAQAGLPLAVDKDDEDEEENWLQKQAGKLQNSLGLNDKQAAGVGAGLGELGSLLMKGELF